MSTHLVGNHLQVEPKPDLPSLPVLEKYETDTRSILYLEFLGPDRDRVSLGSPRTHYVFHAGLNLTEICLSLLPKCWD